MFDKPNQLIFYINVTLIIFGVLVALLTDYFVIGLIFAFSASILVYDQYRQNKSAFTISDLRKILTIHDTNGNKATLTQTQMTTACHVDNSEYWFRNIRAMGSISNFKINDSDPSEQIKENGSYRVCMKLPPELKVVNGSDLILSYEYEDAFTQTEGVLSHVVDNDTRQLHLTVELPAGRSISSARFFCKHDDVEEALLPPVVTGRTKIEAAFKNPKLGAEYCLQWNWSDAGFMKKISRLF